MFKSIKSKLIVLFITLIAGIIGAIGLLVNQQMKEQIYDNVIVQSKGLTEEMRNSIELFTEGYAKNLQHMALSKPVKEYINNVMDEGKSAESTKDLENEFLNYLNLNENITSIYAASETKQLKMVPEPELAEDFDPTTRDWYKTAASQPEKVIWTEPYEDPATKEHVVTLSYAIKEGANVIGVLGVDISLEQLTNMIQSTDVSYNGYPFIFSKDGASIVHPEYRNQNMLEFPYIKAIYDSEQQAGNKNYEHNGEGKMLVYDTVSSTSWKVGIAYSDRDLMETAASLQRTIIIISCIALLISIITIYFIANSMAKPLIQLKNGLNEFAKGNLNIQTNITSKDEIGEVSRHFNQMVAQMKELLTTINHSVGSIKESAESLSAVSEETNASSEEMAAAINEIATGASRSAEEAESAHQLSNQLSTRINEISEHTASMKKLSEKADEINQSGLVQIKNLRESFDVSKEFIASTENVVNELEEKIKKIETVMTTISDISTQTNLLSLNASIEAARAGEHGKGFAVVAEEVRKLAEQSVAATGEVQSTISDIQSGAALAVDSMGKTKENFNSQTNVVEHTETAFISISDLVEDMKDSILFINQEMDEISKDKEDVVLSIQSMAAMSEQAAASCEEVSASTDEQAHAIQSVALSAEQLTELSNDLSDVVSKFED
ncbi:methyl-accepting chemotaxis protein [Cytobacillus horneckiae]|uniref:methyl-accepting chemotaxis protein n=1 Tax=Cytobacillus horneckiae TaxID=549687 RepID=UPI0019D0A8F2|nr:methyl-accepting chemotaxis protein [Cytobacillus horneckiae]MBN6889973.1 methyl-accepting chemotaxis protein [Cytobacillus horneckiae]